MPLFSEEIKSKSPEVQRHLYSAFRDAVKHGEIEALRLLTKFKIPKVRQGQKEVFDFAYTTSTQLAVRSWILANESLPTKGTTAEQIEQMSDDQLSKLIAEQKKSSKKRPRKAKPKATQKAQEEPKTEQKTTTKTPAKPKANAPATPPKPTESTAPKTTATGLSESTMEELRKLNSSKAAADQRRAVPPKKSGS